MEKPLVLASSSPRRRELLHMLGIDFTIVLPTKFVEFTGSALKDPSELVFKNAQGKAEDVAKNQPDAFVLGVDTVVYLDGKIFEKPQSTEEAVQILTGLQGKRHQVYTCQYLLNTQTKEAKWAEDRTSVEFYQMSEQEIRAYVATGEPMDKAGAYAVQGKGARYIKEIHGDFFGVMGLSVSKFMRLYEEMIDPSVVSRVK